MRIGTGGAPNQAMTRAVMNRVYKASRSASMGAGFVVGAGLLAAPFAAHATMYGPDQATCVSAPSGQVGPDGIARPVPNAARDGTGMWSNVIGCGANGGNFLGVQVLGPYAIAAGDGATSLGYASSAGQRGTAIGMQAAASGTGSTALGQWTRATGLGSVAIGGNGSSNTAAAGAQATSNDAVAIAGQSLASGAESIAIGVRSSAVNGGDIAIGADSMADGTTKNLAAVAVGRGSRAIGEDALSLGNSARAEADYAAAIGNYAYASARNATAVGNSAAASGGAATAVGNFSVASGLNAVAIGAGGEPGSYVGAQASGDGAVALGGNRVKGAASAAQDGIAVGGEALVDANAVSGIAVGRGARVVDNAVHGVALGADSIVTVADGVALGGGSVAATQAGLTGFAPATQGAAAVDATRSTLAAVSVGDAAAGKFRQITGVAAGTADSDAVNVSQLKSLALNVNDLAAGAVKYDRNPDGTINHGSITLNPSGTGGSQIHNVAAGTEGTDAVNVDQLHQSIEDNKTRYYSINDNGVRQANADNDGASGVGAMAAGMGARASGEQALSVGNGNTASGARAAAVGSGNTVGGNGSYAYGNGNAIASVDVFVIGSGVTVGAGLDGAVVLGRGSTVAAASPTSRGTINGVEYVYAGGQPVAGDVVSVGSAGAPRQIQHVAAGRVAVDSLDAINGSQLHATNQAIDSLGQLVRDINTGSGTRYFHANGDGGALPDSRASGVGSVAAGPSAAASGAGSVAMGNGAAAGAGGAVAVGAGAQARQQGDVALGEGAVADRGAESYTGKYSEAQNDTAGTVSVGAPGSERTISNVADGRYATDAVNLRQLEGAVKEANDYTDQRIGDINDSVVQVGDTVKELGDRVSQAEGDVTKLKNGAEGMFQVNQDGGNAAPSAEGRNSVAGGAGAVASGSNGTAIGNGATASGSNSTAMGSGAQASGENATAVGSGSKAEANNSVALGAGSVADRNDAVSVGAAGTERQVINVAPGTAGTDAVNLNQLRAAESNLSNQIASVKGDLRRQDNRLSAGVSSAMAMAGLPQAYLPGKSMFSMGGGTWRGESGFAMGLSTVSNNGKWIVKGLASSSSRGDYGASVGVGYQW